ncbi:hypothetical protein I0Q12_19835 [Rhodococcus sp. CX]|uniref:hypothetical protein n=1 Tax=Rhodococcus sp. CX TaxID=2789880 RepID=UPI0018CF3BD4|nr:hypothetical protein [Rhodococcus sp. CX]MBH0121643.1 hypothetical protein [Rhodococcus sp. CX]
MTGQTRNDAAALPLRDTRYRELETYPEFGTVTEWLHDYVQSSVPNPKMGEREYWAVVCLPFTSEADTAQRLCSVHAGAYETACLYVETMPDGQRRLGGFVTVDTAVFERDAGTDVAGLEAANPELRFRTQPTTTTIWWTDTAGSREQFDALPWRPAARHLVTELMRQGKCLEASNHSAQLARFAQADRLPADPLQSRTAES